MLHAVRFVFAATKFAFYLYMLSGDAREDWQPSIPPAKEIRYSVTFRTLRDRAAKESIELSATP